MLSATRPAKTGKPAQYCNTAMSDAMRDAHPNSVRAIVLYNMEECYPVWDQFVHGVPSFCGPPRHQCGNYSQHC
jgi:hypothetical protein